MEPGWLNIKPSRFGTTERLLECIEHCAADGIQMYGGGQFELGVGRRHIQVLASLFYPDGPNDVAPREYNMGDPRPGCRRALSTRRKPSASRIAPMQTFMKEG